MRRIQHPTFAAFNCHGNRLEKSIAYQCTPVAVRSLTGAIRVRWPCFHLPSVVDAEIDVAVENRVADLIQPPGGKAETWEVVSLAEVHDLKC